MLAEVNSQALILPADEDGADDISNNEEKQENIMESWVSQGIENTEKDQASRANKGKRHRQAGKKLSR